MEPPKEVIDELKRRKIEPPTIWNDCHGPTDSDWFAGRNNKQQTVLVFYNKKYKDGVFGVTVLEEPEYCDFNVVVYD